MTKQAKILVVEDDEDWREEIVKSELELAGYVVQTAQDYASASKQLREQSFDVAVVDLNLTDVQHNRDGILVLKDLRKFSKDTIIIIVSGTGGDDGIRAKNEYGAIACLPKQNLNLEEFLDIIAKAVADDAGD